MFITVVLVVVKTIYICRYNCEAAMKSVGSSGSAPVFHKAAGQTRKNRNRSAGFIVFMLGLCRRKSW
jgi:hypothetical protein